MLRLSGLTKQFCYPPPLETWCFSSLPLAHLPPRPRRSHPRTRQDLQRSLASVLQSLGHGFTIRDVTIGRGSKAVLLRSRCYAIICAWTISQSPLDQKRKRFYHSIPKKLDGELFDAAGASGKSRPGPSTDGSSCSSSSSLSIICSNMERRVRLR